MEPTNNSLLDYSKISITDWLYFLNDRADISQNESLFNGLKPHNIQTTEMHEFIKFKTDNFDKYKFSLLIDDTRSFIPIFDAYFDNDLIEDISISFETKYHDLFSPETKLHEFIRKVYKYKPGYFLHGNQFHLIRFSEIAENLYQTICETPGAVAEQSQDIKQYQFTNGLTDTQRGKLYDLLVLNKFIPESDKAGFIWAFGGKNDKYTSFKTEWRKAKNLAVYLIDKLCYDNTANSHFWAIGTRIFGIENMAQMKINYSDVNKMGKPRGFESIDIIINEIEA